MKYFHVKWTFPYILWFTLQDGHFENTYYSDFISNLGKIQYAGQLQHSQVSWPWPDVLVRFWCPDRSVHEHIEPRCALHAPWEPESFLQIPGLPHHSTLLWEHPLDRVWHTHHSFTQPGTLHRRAFSKILKKNASKNFPYSVRWKHSYLVQILFAFRSGSWRVL